MNDNASSSEDTILFTPKPSLSPPPNTTGIVGWMRFNLFDGFFNSILTVISFIILALIAIGLTLVGLMCVLTSIILFSLVHVIRERK